MTMPAAVVAALDALEATNPSYSGAAAKARADVERAIREALAPTAAAVVVLRAAPGLVG
jgi:hypothetical protein